MSFYQHQDFDFIQRTRKIIQQYKKCNLGEEKYEVTLFINCLIGLFILPQQRWYNDLSKELISKQEWGIDEADIEFSSNEKTVKNVACHLRNSISHYNFRAIPNASNEIESLEIDDFTDYTKTTRTFRAVFSIDSLQHFTTTLTDVLLKKMEQQK